MSVIRVEHLDKCFYTWRKPWHRLLYRFAPDSTPAAHETWALRDVSLEVERGETLGIIGRNGSGKSTLLRIIAGLSRGTAGEVEVTGRISTLLRLGAGFHPDFGGRDNIRLAGRLVGLDRATIDERTEEILRFSGLGSAIDRPVRTYSSGMFVRLAFSVAIHVDPELLLIDEVLAVGDELFQQRCLAKIREIQERGTTVVIVSHDMNTVAHHCTRAFLLDRSRAVAAGPPGEVIAAYRDLLLAGGDLDGPEAAPAERTGQVELEARITDGAGRVRRHLVSGDEAVFSVRLRSPRRIERPVVGFVLRDQRGYEIATTNTAWQGQPLPPLEAGGEVTVSFRHRLPVGRGRYGVAPVGGRLLEDSGEEQLLEAAERSAVFEVIGDIAGRGPLHLASRIETSGPMTEEA